MKNFTSLLDARNYINERKFQITFEGGVRRYNSLSEEDAVEFTQAVKFLNGTVTGSKNEKKTDGINEYFVYSVFFTLPKKKVSFSELAASYK